MPLAQESYSLRALVQKCSSITSLRRARELHALILTIAKTRSPYTYNNLISMYTRCGSLYDAQLMFDKMPQRSLVSFNALMSAYSKTPDHTYLALKLITQMEFDCVRPDGSTFTSLLRASGMTEDWLMGSLLHTRVLKQGHVNDVCVQTSVLGMYSNCGDLKSSDKIFECIGYKDAVSWNCMIVGKLKNDKIKEGFHLFCCMVRSGVTPTRFTYSMMFNACSRLQDYFCGQLFHAQVIVSNPDADLPLQNALLDMYFNCGDLESAFSVFSRIRNPDLVSWNSVITGCLKNGNGEKAIDLFIRLQRISFPKPDEYTFAAVISATALLLASEYGKLLHSQVTKTGFHESLFVGTTLVSMYFRNSDPESAARIFSSISAKDVILWTEMIMGWSRMANGECAINSFRQMYLECNSADSFSLSGALGACADQATLKQGEMIHCLAVKLGYETDMSVSGSLIDMYAKSGTLAAAQSIFSALSNPDLKCWNSMVLAYGHHGMADKALMIFDRILKHGHIPDQITYLSLLSACSHGGFVEKGKFFWVHMKENGCLPGPKHYSCMVSLLSRAGLLDEAEELVNESPYSEGYPELGRTLLSSCVTHRNLRIGVHVAEKILRLDSEGCATHVLVSNFYAALGRWDRVAEMRRKKRGLALEKDPGLSWIEVRNSVRVFSSGDESQPDIDESRQELHRLQNNMKKINGEFDLEIILSKM
ncbi:pentatricopeptide repeat-containing protein At3g50420-like [Carica papaya]|uniref:pentatricopeptide repeat-containing protein At3g50420-like n=1 Tax=Carica papaya TaxID=3649 RepID=UPI000B8CF79B|nr:pentatricopeptide repeat-containing protein At3g50420-like [Carica papaya]